MNLNDYMNLFSPELNKLLLSYENVVLCGSQILRLHGLELGWEPDDLDVAIYLPTDIQIGFIEEQHPCSDYHEDNGQTRAWNITKYTEIPTQGVTVKVSHALNILVDYENPLPERNYTEYRGFKIQPIDEIIKWKSLYFNSGDKKEKVRIKDAEQLQMLKNLNFNL